MAVYCSECGEELLGTVNRCWRCGTLFKTLPESLPPVRRQPVESEPAGASVPLRRGSPFAPGGDNLEGVREVSPSSQFTRPQPIAARYARHTAATGGAIGALVLGILAAAATWLVPIGALLTALFGLALGVWGTYSQRRQMAILGMLLCCLVLAVAGFLSAIELYEWVYGHTPWDAEAELLVE